MKGRINIDSKPKSNRILLGGKRLTEMDENSAHNIEPDVIKSSLLEGAKDKINDNDFLDVIPQPVIEWELKEKDILLVYLNKAAKKIIKQELSTAIQLSIALTQEYKKIFYTQSFEYLENSFS